MLDIEHNVVHVMNERGRGGVTEEVNQRDAFSYKNVLHTHTYSVLNVS